MESVNINNAGIRLSERMGNWLTNFIANNHVITGLMRDVTRIRFISHKYDNRIRFIWSLVTTEYFRYVEKKRKDDNKK